MHNNYYFIHRLSSELQESLAGAELQECFSQNKSELVISWVKKDKSDGYLIATLGADFSSLYMPGEFHKARHNAVPYFQDLYGAKLKRIVQA
ncbi:MAG: hypothetical protein ACJ75J_15965, partial [Cytophagaceae bacterium]